MSHCKRAGGGFPQRGAEDINQSGPIQSNRQEADRVAVARLKRSRAPELLTDAEKQALTRDRNTWLEKTARYIGKSVRNISRLILTRRGRSGQK